MEFSQVINRRHSVRDFTDQPVAREDLLDIARAALTAPSWVNSQPWRIYIATGTSLADIKARHREHVDAGDGGHSDFPVMHRTDWSPVAQANMAGLGAQIGEYFGDEGRAFAASQSRLFNAQAIAYLTVPVGSSQWSIHDLGGLSMTLVLAAFDQGLGAINAYELVKYPDDVRRVMGISNQELLAVGVALGYPADNKLGTFAPAHVKVDEVVTLKD
ncbi:nitroreductase [Actinomyces ruminicola]|nr:nitroreductase [Actinomyces ruminicola]